MTCRHSPWTKTASWRAAARPRDQSCADGSIGSGLAERVPGPGLSLYSLSKAALVGLTKGHMR
jgi:3-oxoacyl-[acyl-carrier protein] reductase